MIDPAERQAILRIKNSDGSTVDVQPRDLLALRDAVAHQVDVDELLADHSPDAETPAPVRPKRILSMILLSAVVGGLAWIDQGVTTAAVGAATFAGAAGLVVLAVWFGRAFYSMLLDVDGFIGLAYIAGVGLPCALIAPIFGSTVVMGAACGAVVGLFVYLRSS